MSDNGIRLGGPSSILFVTYGWHETGGGTLFPRAVARELAHRGYGIAVVYASLQSDPTLPPCAIHRSEEDGIQLFGMINRPALFSDPDNPQREIDDPAVREAFGQVLDEVKPDLVHFHNFHGLTFSIAEEVHRRNIPSCFTPHNYHLIDPELYLLKNGLVRWDDVNPLAESEAVARNPQLREWYLKRVETARRLVNEWLGITLAVSQRQRELLARFGARSERIAVVHQSSPAADRLWADASLAAERLRRIQRPLQVGYIGGVIPIKGLQLLVTAAQSFTPEELQVHLYGFTDPHFEAELRDSDRRGMVMFHGAYQPGDLARIAQLLDVAVIPSIVEESAPTLVLAELFAMRIPVIASKAGGIPEFISEGIDGKLYPTYELETLIHVLKELVDDPGCLETMRRNLVAPTHTFAHYMEHIEKIYALLLSGEIGMASRLNLMASKRQAAASIDLPRISWHGGLFANNSLAHVNRELNLQLLSKGYTISYNSTEADEFTPSVDPRFSILETIRDLPLDRVDITIRHQWPPDFTPLSSGKLVLIQPWEFGSLPKEWIPHFTLTVDEVWVPSNYVRECYISSGVPKERVQVVPNGVDTTLLTPDALPLQLKTTKRFRFLFVGGTIHRKGIDLLLGAYFRTFTAADDVCLVIKDMGGASVYEGQTAGELIERFQQDPRAPEIEYLDRTLTPAEMAGLYTACHCLVHPYRGEGFGLPIAEAMACGLAPIVTGYGAALDFCNQNNAWLIPASVEKLPFKQVGNRETVDFPWLAEPNFYALCDMMRHAALHPDEVTGRGRIASLHIHEHFTWEQAARKVEERLQALVAHPATSVETAHEESAEDMALRTQLVGRACVRARIQAQRGEVDSAVQTLVNHGIRSDPTSPVPYCELTEILMAAGRYNDALQVVAEMPPDSDQALMREIEALCHARLGNDEAARQAAHRANERPRAQVVLGTLAVRGGEANEAEIFFRRAIGADPACASAWLSLGMLLWGQEQREEAWRAVQRALVADPLRSEVVAISLDMAGRCGQLPAVLEIISQAAQAYPDSRNLARTHTELLVRCGYTAAALEACQAFLVDFGVDENLLDMALELRNSIGVVDRRSETGQSGVSLCMIVKNEEAHLARCLSSVKTLVGEMIVVDTGSQDRTVDIATIFGARTFPFPWTGSFCDARNHALEQATGDWILVLDADEQISARDLESIRRTTDPSAGRKAAWSVVTRNYTTQVNTQGWTANEGSYPREEAADGWYPSWKVRLFPNLSFIRFSGDVHEMVEPSLRQHGFAIHGAPFVVHHYGGLASNGQQEQIKQVRYFEIGLQKLEQNPHDRIALTELAVQAGELGLFEKAIELWDRVLALQPDMEEALFNKGYCLIGMKRYHEALDVSGRVVRLNPGHKEAAFNYATCELYVGDAERALKVVFPLAERNPDYPLLQALLVLLHIASNQLSPARVAYRRIRALNYDVAGYVQGRAEALAALGRDSLAAQLRAGLKMLQEFDAGEDRTY